MMSLQKYLNNYSIRNFWHALILGASFLINSSIAFSKGIQDTLSPYIMDNFFSNDSLFFKFSEPISLNHNTEIFSFINKASGPKNLSINVIANLRVGKALSVISF